MRDCPNNARTNASIEDMQASGNRFHNRFRPLHGGKISSQNSCCPCIQKKTPPKMLLCFCMPTRHLPKMSSCLCIQKKTLSKMLLRFCTSAESVQKDVCGLCMTAKAFTQMLWYLCMPYACQNKEKEKTEGAPGTGICMETKKRNEYIASFPPNACMIQETALNLWRRRMRYL